MGGMAGLLPMAWRGGGLMINLIPWRERRLRKYRHVALFIVSSCYMLIITPVMFYLQRMEQDKQALSKQFRGLKLHRRVVSNTVRNQVMAINQLVWSKRRYVLSLMRMLAKMPPDIILQNVQCHLTTCEFDVTGTSAQQINKVFANNEVKDLTQGGCSQCYRAKIDVKLS
jgi:radical SAM superfamily enzyme